MNTSFPTISILIGIALLFQALGATAQDKNIHALICDKAYYECENKWVAFCDEDTGEYLYGLVYLDLEAGFTLDLHGKFKITEEGQYVLLPKSEELKESSIKIRLEPDTREVSIIPPHKVIEELALP